MTMKRNFSVFIIAPVFEKPYGDHSEGQEECVEEQGEAVQFVQLQLLFIITNICGDYAPCYLFIHYAIKIYSEIKMMMASYH